MYRLFLANNSQLKCWLKSSQSRDIATFACALEGDAAPVAQKDAASPEASSSPGSRRKCEGHAGGGPIAGHLGGESIFSQADWKAVWMSGQGLMRLRF